MPIVFVHGVATRDDGERYAARWQQIRTFLERYIAPAISANPAQVAIEPAYWGGLAATFAWDGASRPRSPLLGMGAAGDATPADQALTLAGLPETTRNLPAAAPTGGPGVLIAGGGGAAGSGGAGLRLKDLTPDQLSDLAVTALQGVVQEPKELALAAIAADTVAQDPETRRKLAAAPDQQQELATLRTLVEEAYRAEQQRQGVALIGQGALDWSQPFIDRIGEAADRAGSAPGFVLSRAVAELRKPLNDMITLFLGDVFTYLKFRGDPKEPGRIPLAVLKKLQEVQAKRTDEREPLVVLSHSMGGQLVYDLASTFIPQSPAFQDLRIDFWCASASQVGLFEELKLFAASDPQFSRQSNQAAPFPDRRYLGGWWNVWDHNDFLSFTVKSIFAGVDDAEFNTGLSLIHAHSGYIERPSFYRAFADKLVAAREENWWRP
jgi:hypothetical protein